MKKILTFNKVHFTLFLILLIVETLIAIYLKGGFIRHTFGDFLVVILLYTFFKSFLDVKPLYLGLGVLLFSCLIEFLQMFDVLKIIHLENNKLANIILGSTFHVSDLTAYTLGTLFVLVVEFLFKTYGKH